MASLFSDRLDFLMSLTNTTNSALARELSFDASYISRIRNGKRGVPIHQPFVEPAAAYLAARVRESYQVQTIEQVLRLHRGWPDAPDRQAQLIAAWLVKGVANLDVRFDKLVEGMSAPRRSSSPDFRSAVEFGRDGVAASVRCFMGQRGKRDATLCFLAELAELDGPQTLLLYSDESMEWLSEDAAFSQRWTALLMQLIVKGASIRIVHTITRDIGEMLDAVQKWLPLYLTGHITSYYCPRLRDGICRRTLFVAPGRCALTSNSVEGQMEGMANVLTADKGMVDALEKEFENLFELCRPLVGTIAEPDLSEPGDASRIVVRHGEAGRFAHLGLPVRETDRLPFDVIVLFEGEDGFTLVNLSEPRIALRVAERVLTAAFDEYLR